MGFYERAKELEPQLVQNRRHLHEHAEVGMELTRTVQFVADRLSEMGYEPKELGGGVTAAAGSGGPVLLLRADMDALPMTETSGVEFACKTGATHACGHDLHTAMLLGAAKLLKEREKELKGTVKFMFQPGEEVFRGAKSMVEAGILENPAVDAALGTHVSANGRAGMIFYNDEGTQMASCDGFRITVRGKSAHGAIPHEGVDPINIGAHLYFAFQELISREVSQDESCVMTIGRIEAGSAANIIPDTLVMEGTIRTMSKETRAFLTSRMREITSATAALFRGSAEVEMLSEVPPLVCDPGLVKEMLGYGAEMNAPGFQTIGGARLNSSEDFAVIADRVPSCFLFLAAGDPETAEEIPMHNPRVRFGEDILPFGAALFAQCAARWLETHAKR